MQFTCQLRCESCLCSSGVQLVPSTPVVVEATRTASWQPGPVLHCPVLSCPVLPVLLCPVLSCPFPACPALSCPALSCPVLLTTPPKQHALTPHRSGTVSSWSAQDVHLPWFPPPMCHRLHGSDDYHYLTTLLCYFAQYCGCPYRESFLLLCCTSPHISGS